MEIARPARIFEKREPGRIFSSYEDGIAYVILVLENPKQRDPLSRFIEEIGQYSLSGKAERFEQDLSGAGFTGKEYSFSYGTSLSGLLRFHLGADRVYVLEAVGEVASKPAVKQSLWIPS